MIKNSHWAIAVVVLALASVSRAAQQPAGAQVPDGKVVVINTSVFPDQIGELKQKYLQVESQFKERSDRLTALQQQVTQKETEYQTKGPSMASDKARELQAEIEELKKRATRELEDVRHDYGKALEAATKPIRDKLFQFLQNYAVGRSIVMIMDLPGVAQTGSLAYWNPGADITEDFIKEYNKANPLPAAPAPAQPAGAKPATGTKPPGER
jgi:outer membrane protein